MADKIKTAMMFYDIEDSTIGSGLFVAVGRFRDGTVLRTEPALSYKAVSTALGERLDAVVRSIPPSQQEAFCKDKLWTDDTPESRAAGEGLWALGVSYAVMEKREDPEVFELSFAQIENFGILQEINRRLLHACGIRICVDFTSDGDYRIYFEMQKRPRGGFLLSIPTGTLNIFHERSSFLYALRNLNGASRTELGVSLGTEGMQVLEPYPDAFSVLSISRRIDNRLIELYPELAPDEPSKNKEQDEQEAD